MIKSLCLGRSLHGFTLFPPCLFFFARYLFTLFLNAGTNMLAAIMPRLVRRVTVWERIYGRGKMEVSGVCFSGSFVVMCVMGCVDVGVAFGCGTFVKDVMLVWYDPCIADMGR
ncbi:hypothetical protein J3E74DRAFT_33568 [Bipolaris maydis]|nr:hypothetical protein J3E74DRAFT_33568 [Bipolaris maydis]